MKYFPVFPSISHFHQKLARRYLPPGISRLGIYRPTLSTTIYTANKNSIGILKKFMGALKASLLQQQKIVQPKQDLNAPYTYNLL